MRVGEVAVVVVEAKGQALEDRRRQLRRIEAPLLSGIAPEEGFVELDSNHAERLLLEIGRAWNRLGLRGDERARLLWPHDLAKELVHGQEVERQRIHHPPGDRLDAMTIGPHGPESLNVGPNTLVAGVKYMGAVHMGHDAGLRIASRMAIAGHMRALVDHEDFVPCLGERATDNGAAESGADDAISHGNRFRLFEERRGSPARTSLYQHNLANSKGETRPAANAGRSGSSDPSHANRRDANSAGRGMPRDRR
jgi:hypothetical protein